MTKTNDQQAGERTHRPLGGTCSTCGAENEIVNQCGCDAANLPTRVPSDRIIEWHKNPDGTLTNIGTVHRAKQTVDPMAALRELERYCKRNADFNSDEAVLWSQCQQIASEAIASTATPEKDLLYRIGKTLMESRATGEPVNLGMIAREIDELLYPAKQPERSA